MRIPPLQPKLIMHNVDRRSEPKFSILYFHIKHKQLAKYMHKEGSQGIIAQYTNDTTGTINSRRNTRCSITKNNDKCVQYDYNF